MKKPEEFMKEFMNTWDNMMKYQDIDITKSNRDDIQKAFSEEKRIVATYEPSEIKETVLIEDKRKTWQEQLKIDVLPRLPLKENSEIKEENIEER